MPFEIGEVIAGKYRVERMLGAGGMGVVVEAFHLDLDQRVALKFLSAGALDDTEARRRFAREARAASRISGEHVARILDTGTLATGAPFIVMEFLDGVDLQTLLESRHAIPPAEAVDYVLQALQALAEAHALGIVHRDIKPSNLFLTRRADGSPCLKIVDFGIAKMVEASRAPREAVTTSTTTLLGSPRYMAPEQLLSTRAADGRADLWSLGVVLHELVTGASPFRGATLPQICSSILHGEPDIRMGALPDAARGLERVVRTCLERNVNRRYPNATAFAEALRPFAEGDAVGAVDRVRRVAATRSGSLSDAPISPITAPNLTPISPAAHTLSAEELAPAQPVVGASTLSSFGKSARTGRSSSRNLAVAGAIGVLVLAAIGALALGRPNDAPALVTREAASSVLGTASQESAEAIEPPLAPLEPSAIAPDPSAVAPSAAPSVARHGVIRVRGSAAPSLPRVHHESAPAASSAPVAVVAPPPAAPPTPAPRPTPSTGFEDFGDRK